MRSPGRERGRRRVRRDGEAKRPPRGSRGRDVKCQMRRRANRSRSVPRRSPCLRVARREPRATSDLKRRDLLNRVAVARAVSAAVASHKRGYAALVSRRQAHAVAARRGQRDVAVAIRAPSGGAATNRAVPSAAEEAEVEGIAGEEGVAAEGRAEVAVGRVAGRPVVAEAAAAVAPGVRAESSPLAGARSRPRSAAGQ